MSQMQQLANSPVGRLVPVSGRDPRSQEWIDGQGFAPHPLPTIVDFDRPTWLAITTAVEALARLDGAARRLPDPALVREPLLRREAQSTSALEGTYVPFDEVMATTRAEAAGRRGDLREVLNYAECADSAFAIPVEQALSRGLLGQLQEILVSGTASEKRDAGDLRDRTVLIGSRDGGFEDARFVPGPHGPMLVDGLEAWLAWIRRPPALPSVVVAAMAHYQFETLHPYSDGNGRLGRLLAALHLVRSGTLRDPVLVLSPWLEARRDQYQHELFEMSRTGEWGPWVSFFARAVRASAVDTTRRIDALFDLRATWAERARGGRGRAVQVVDLLLEQPVITANEVAERLAVSPSAARQATTSLVELDIVSVREPTRRGRTQRYFADEVIRILSGGVEDD